MDGRSLGGTRGIGGQGSWRRRRSRGQCSRLATPSQAGQGGDAREIICLPGRAQTYPPFNCDPDGAMSIADQSASPLPCFEPEDGFCWIVRALPPAFAEFPPDTMEGSFSRLVVEEDGRPLAQPHAPHSEIRSLGAGRFSHWGGTVRFATSDNSSPLENGRRYTVAVDGLRVALAPAAWIVADKAEAI